MRDEEIDRFDRALQVHIEERLAAYPKLREPLQISVKGRIVHISGSLENVRDLYFIRKTISRIKGTAAVWDLIGLNGNQPRVLDIGCGSTKQFKTAVGIDCQAFNGVDVVVDIERNLPFISGEFDYVFAVHILEHVRNLTGLMNELHRVMKENAVLHLMTPHSESLNSIADPNHVRLFNLRSIEYFCRPNYGILPFLPISASSDSYNVYADLIPVKNQISCLDENELAYFFNLS